MSVSYRVESLPKSPFRSINGREYSVWSYLVSWDAADAPSGRVALALPSAIDVRDPSFFPDEPAVAGSQLFRSTAEGKTYVSVAAPAAPELDVTIALVAPSSSSSATPVSVLLQDVVTETWSTVPFAVGTGTALALVQSLEGPAEEMTLGAPAPDVAEARPASRRVPKATLVSVQVPQSRLFRDQGAAIEKYNFLHRLQLAQGEVEGLAATLREAPGAIATVRKFEGISIASALPPASDLADLPSSTLLAFGEAIVESRKARLPEGGRAAARPQPANVMSGGFELHPDTTATVDYQNAFAALASFRNAFKVSPIGMLNLERLEMTPAGIQRGELIATVPLAPREKTSVTHKEWSVTSREFTSIVTDSLENYSEKGVTENTELAAATTSQTSHANQFNVNATLTGTYGPVTATVSTGFGAQDADSHSASESRRHAVATTRTASSRVKQEHKVTVSTTSTIGTLDTSTRILENVSDIDPIRVDYFSLLRKWHVALLRYGLRLTYDIAVPEPGATLRAVYARMEELRSALGRFEFTVAPADITPTTFLALAAEFSVVLPAPPENPKEVSIISTYTESGDTQFFGTIRVMDIEIPDGFTVTSADLFINMQSDEHIADIFIPRVNVVLGSAANPVPFLVGREGKQYLTYSTQGSPSGALELDLQLKPTAAAIAEWQQQAWSVLFGAAQAKYYADQQRVQAELEDLTAQISNVNTLTLRREENEEIMKAALKWILGPTFAFMPSGRLADLRGPTGSVWRCGHHAREHGVRYGPLGHAGQLGDDAAVPGDDQVHQRSDRVGERALLRLPLFLGYSVQLVVHPKSSASGRGSRGVPSCGQCAGGLDRPPRLGGGLGHLRRDRRLWRDTLARPSVHVDRSRSAGLRPDELSRHPAGESGRRTAARRWCSRLDGLDRHAGGWRRTGRDQRAVERGVPRRLLGGDRQLRAGNDDGWCVHD